MKITFEKTLGKYELKIWNPEFHIKASTERLPVVNLKFQCSGEEYREISKSCISLYYTFPKIILESSYQLIILGQALLGQINFSQVVEVSPTECLEIDMTLYPITIEHQDILEDSFVVLE